LERIYALGSHIAYWSILASGVLWAAVKNSVLENFLLVSAKSKLATVAALVYFRPLFFWPLLSWRMIAPKLNQTLNETRSGFDQIWLAALRTQCAKTEVMVNETGDFALCNSVERDRFGERLVGVLDTLYSKKEPAVH